MHTLAKASLGLLATALLLAVPAGPVASQSPSPTAAPGPIQFGMDAGAVSAQSAAGVKPDYGTFWIGPWTLSSGWGGPDAQLTAMKNAGVTPAIHFYYWGDDISPSCVENGCWSSLHNAQKTRAGWEQLGTQLTDHLNSKMQGKPVVIFLESEFNKGGIENYEPFDGYMAVMANKIHAAYPNAIIVLGFGNWGSHAWGTFDRAAAASDMVGIQGMRGSTKQSKTDMMTLYDGLLSGVKTLGAKFPGKPIMITDVAVSSYPEPEYLGVQRDVLKEVFDNLGTLKAHGVEAIIYRSWKDSPNMDLANYYGMAERYWGLANSAGLKPSAHVWIDGVKAERAGSTPAPAPAATPSSYKATVEPSRNSNEWWIQVGVAPAPAKVETKVGSGAFVAMDKQSYGWTKSLHAPSGTMVQFRVTSTSGETATTPAQAWLVDMSPRTATASDSPAPASSSTSTSSAPANRAPVAAFTVTADGLRVAVDAARSMDPEGQPLTYSWSFGDGGSATGRLATHTYAAAGTYTVKLAASDGLATSTVSESVTVTKPYAATFTTQSGSNQYWVEVKVAASPAPAKVAVKAGDGPWQPLVLRSWGAWGDDIAIPKGTPVSFAAVAPDGQVAKSAPAPWLSSGTTTSTSSAPATSTSATSTGSTSFKASFSPKAVGNDWWVETAVSGNQPVAKVEAKVGGGSWTTLAKQDWGTHAKSLHAPDGTYVQFRATSSTGATATSPTYVWG